MAGVPQLRLRTNWGMRYRETLTVPVTLHRDGRTPLHDQIADQLISAIRAGSLTHGTRMPSTRTLAGLLGVSRGVAATGYDVLTARGFAEGRGGSGTYVVAGQPVAGGPHRSLGRSEPRHRATDVRRPVRRAEADVAEVDLTPGRVNAEIFPLAAWRSAWRQASCQVPGLDGLPELGLPRLRRAIAEHLVRTRGLALTDHEVIVTGGTVPGLRLVLDAVEPGPVAVEEPGVPTWRRAVSAAGREAVTVESDADGVRIGDVPAGCRAVVLTTDGHIGWGRTLTARRRLQAARWSTDTGGTIVEMACDAVFRPVSGRLPRLLDLAGDTVLVGGFCEALTPALRLGYLVVPRRLVADIGRTVAERGEQPPYVAQLAVTRLLADGTVTRQMHRRGLVQRHQLAIVEDALAPLRPTVSVHGQDAAGSVVVQLPEAADVAAVAATLRRHGVTVPVMGPRTLLLGHGHLPDAELRRGLSTLVSVLRAATGGGTGALAA